MQASRCTKVREEQPLFAALNLPDGTTAAIMLSPLPARLRAIRVLLPMLVLNSVLTQLTSGRFVQLALPATSPGALEVCRA